MEISFFNEENIEGKELEKKLEKYEKNISLIKRYQNWEENLIQDIIEENMWFVGYIIKNYRNYIISWEVSRTEMETAWITWLIESAKEFNLELWHKFTTYSFYNIRKEIQYCIADKLWIKVWYFLAKNRVKYFIFKKLKENENYIINYKEISDALNMTEKRVKNLLYNNLEYAKSLNEKVGKYGENELIDFITDWNSIEDELYEEKVKNIWFEILDILDVREKEILSLRIFWHDWVEKTLEKIWQEKWLSKQRIKQIEETWLLKLSWAHYIAKILYNQFGEKFSYNHTSINEIIYIISNYKNIYHFLGFKQKERSFIEWRYDKFTKKINLDILAIILSIDDIYDFEDKLLDKIENFINVWKYLLGFYWESYKNLDISKYSNLSLSINKKVILFKNIDNIDTSVLGYKRKNVLDMLLSQKYSINEVIVKLWISKENLKKSFFTWLIVIDKHLNEKWWKISRKKCYWKKEEKEKLICENKKDIVPEIQIDSTISDELEKKSCNNIKENNKLTLLQTFFYNYNWLNKEQAYNKLIWLNSLNILMLRYEWLWIKKIVELSWWENQNNVKLYTKEWFIEWINWFFEKNKKQI